MSTRHRITWIAYPSRPVPSGWKADTARPSNSGRSLRGAAAV